MSTTHDPRTLGSKLDNGASVGDDLKARIRQGADNFVEDSRETLENLRGKLRGQVRERPMTSLVVAGGIGLLLGLLIARKR